MTPLIMMMGSKKELWSEAEKRALAPLPNLPQAMKDVPPFFAEIDDYLDDHFGGRDFFLRRYQREIEKRFNKSTIHPRVIKGLDGYYFFNDFGLLEDFLGITPLSKSQLHKFMHRLQQKHDWLNQHGIRYLYAIAPNKQTIYPEYLMKNALRLKGMTRFEQLLAYTDNSFPEYVINLNSSLTKKASQNQLLYYKNDSHWNKYAAYIVFREIMDTISNWFPGEDFQLDFEFIGDETGIGGNTGEGGDLVRILRQPHLEETYPQIKYFNSCDNNRPSPLPYQLSNITYKRGRHSFVRRCSSQKLRAVIFRDSFFVPLEPFFSENFAETIYLWKSFDENNITELLEHYKPDIVIEMVLERHAFDFLTAKE